MGLTETLIARLRGQGRTARVDCGALGAVTVEALPLRELELLLRGPDGARAVFYAACRELQLAGEELRKAGQLYTPDGILQAVSEQEANSALTEILKLSGWDGEKLSEVRLPSVQENPAEIRLSSVQDAEGTENTLTESKENRPETVQTAPGNSSVIGQVSREASAENGTFDKILPSDRKTQVLDVFPAVGAQNVVSGEMAADGVPSGVKEPLGGLHETKSEFDDTTDGALHEIKSDFGADRSETLHETESDFTQTLHETESEFPQSLHEVESESPRRMHETESEFEEKPGRTLHETKSDPAEQLARVLLEGLLRAKWVRGG